MKVIMLEEKLWQNEEAVRGQLVVENVEATALDATMRKTTF